jgi:hypothetical protein
MIAVRECRWTGREWHITVDVREGVYRRIDYPVTLTYLGPLPEGDRGRTLREALRTVMTAAVRAHMRKGSLPPGGLLLNWRRLIDEAFRGDGLDGVRDLANEIDQAVGTVAFAEGHGYFHPFHRERRLGLTARE